MAFEVLDIDEFVSLSALFAQETRRWISVEVVVEEENMSMGKASMDEV